MNIQTIFPISKSMSGLQLSDVVQVFTKMIAETQMVVMHVHYPLEDHNNHKSLNTLVASLSGHGMTETAALIEYQCPILVTHDLTKANRVFHEIQKDSAAISVTLHYRGLVGVLAEEKLYNDVVAFKKNETQQ